MDFVDVLEKFEIKPSHYLRKARGYCSKFGYDPRKLLFAGDTKHKLRYIIDDKKSVKFGNLNNYDYILVSFFNQELAEKKRNAYLKRSGAIKGNWKENKYSKNNLARRLLWAE
jgi:hypothetical protein